MTYFLPPLNLIPLCMRPLRLILPSERLRSARIVLLKASHSPLIAAIWLYEQLADSRKRDSNVTSFSGPQTPLPLKKAPRLAINTPRLLLADSQATPKSPGKMQPLNRLHTRSSRTTHRNGVAASRAARSDDGRLMAGASSRLWNILGVCSGIKPGTDKPWGITHYPRQHCCSCKVTRVLVKVGN
ncbi:hypothetical protein GQ44DRAFT_31572 [Phaeosphaeriaceae sp. PMI808]|nr:hypothetical protein GQ44DRAFT_31572 [Phaeosphaeriaceae sp. PMI808]